MSVASPVAPGARSVDARAAWKLSRGGARTEHATATPTATTSAAVAATPTSTRRRGDRTRRGRRCASMRARSAAGASTPFHSAPRERDRPLLLGKSVGELRGRSDSRLERDTLLRRERPVGERRQLGDLPIAALVFSTTSHRHGTKKGNAERAASRRRKSGFRRARLSRVKRDLAVATREARRSRRSREANPGGQRVGPSRSGGHRFGRVIPGCERNRPAHAA